MVTAVVDSARSRCGSVVASWCDFVGSKFLWPSRSCEKRHFQKALPCLALLPIVLAQYAPTTLSQDALSRRQHKHGQLTTISTLETVVEYGYLSSL